MPIETPDDLREHIELAISIELSTVPPYLFAMYSIEDQQSEAARLLRSIVVEEMLHAALATNLLLAVGGTPRYDTTTYMSRYPGALPHHVPPLILDLAACSPDLIRDVFMRIERPETHDAPVQPDRFETLGQFYHALELALDDLSSRFDLFSDPHLEAQMANPGFYTPVEFDAEDSGGLLAITDLASAIEAIEIIVHQGEGLSEDRWADPGHQELTHYHKLLQIDEGASPLGSVRNVRTNPRTADYPSRLRPVSDLFNASYRYVFDVMAGIFSGTGDQGQAVDRLYGLMSNVLSKLGGFLVGQEIGGDEVAAPTFEVYEFESDDHLGELGEMARLASDRFPDLDGVRRALEKMGANSLHT